MFPFQKLFKQRAFTLIELLVVILIIGILIAVAAPSFLGQQDKAHDSSVKQELTVGRKNAKAVYVNDQGYSTTMDLVTKLNDSEPQYDYVAGAGTADYSKTSVVVENDHSVSMCLQSHSSTFFCLLTDEEAVQNELSADSGQSLFGAETAYAAGRTDVRRSKGTTEAIARDALTEDSAAPGHAVTHDGAGVPNWDKAVTASAPSDDEEVTGPTALASNKALTYSSTNLAANISQYGVSTLGSTVYDYTFHLTAYPAYSYLDYPDLSPDRKLVVSASSYDESRGFEANKSIFVVNADGTGLHAVKTCDSTCNIGFAKWDADGNGILATVFDGDYNYSNIYHYDVDGSNETNLTNSTSGLYYRVAEVPGNKLLVRYTPDGNSDNNYVMNSDGSGKVSLNDAGGASQYHLAPSPDGSRAAYLKNGVDRTEVWIVNLTTMNKAMAGYVAFDHGTVPTTTRYYQEFSKVTFGSDNRVYFNTYDNPPVEDGNAGEGSYQKYSLWSVSANGGVASNEISQTDTPSGVVDR